MNNYELCHGCEFHFTEEELYPHKGEWYCMNCLWGLYQRGEQWG